MRPHSRRGFSLAPPARAWQGLAPGKTAFCGREGPLIKATSTPSDTLFQGALTKTKQTKQGKAGRSLFTWGGVILAYFVVCHIETTYLGGTSAPVTP
jgi:hypothetical protein